MMLKAMVIGSPGAGKSTFARKLRDATELPLYYLDMLWHKPDRTNISTEEFDMRLREIVNKDRWIIDFHGRDLPHIYKLLEKYRKEKQSVIFRSRKETDEYLKELPLRQGLIWNKK